VHCALMLGKCQLTARTHARTHTHAHTHTRTAALGLSAAQQERVAGVAEAEQVPTLTTFMHPTPCMHTS
jgi:hypothetical protein